MGDREAELIHLKLTFPSKLLPSSLYWKDSPPVWTLERGPEVTAITLNVTDAQIKAGQQEILRLPKLLAAGVEWPLQGPVIPIRQDLSGSDLDSMLTCELAIRGSRA